MKQINVLGYSITITIERVALPSVGTLPTGKRARRKLAQQVDAMARTTMAQRKRKGILNIHRIKHVRDISGVGLMQSKAWVEMAFDDNGAGEVI